MKVYYPRQLPGLFRFDSILVDEKLRLCIWCFVECGLAGQGMWIPKELVGFCVLIATVVEVVNCFKRRE